MGEILEPLFLDLAICVFVFWLKLERATKTSSNLEIFGELSTVGERFLVIKNHLVFFLG